MKIINLFGGPGSGKSTTAAFIFSQLKINNISCQYINEYAKDCVYEGRNTVIQNDQLYILAKQNHKLKMLELSNQAQYAIVDSPLLLSSIYGGIYNSITKNFNDYVIELFNSYDNINFFIERNEAYFETNGRIQKNIQQAKDIDNLIKNFLIKNGIKFSIINNITDFPLKDFING